MDDYKAWDEANLKALKLVIEAYDAAADKFINKVETRLAHSKVTYNELKAARNMSRELV